MPNSQMYFFGQEVVSLTRLTRADTYLTCTPLFHGNAQFMAVYPALIAGAQVVVRPKFSASRWVDHLRENQVTVTNLIGVMMDFVWKQPARSDDADNVLRCVYAAPTASSILRGIHGPVRHRGIRRRVRARPRRAPRSCGPYGEVRPPGAAGLVASDWFEIRLVDPDTDRDVPVGQVGELVVRYKQPWTCSLGYYGMPEKTVEAWRNLWFHTGDALRRDEEGWYYFVDRYKDALRRRGENISSYEVEQALLGHPGLVGCAVVGVPADVDAGEDEVLAVVVTSGELKPMISRPRNSGTSAGAASRPSQSRATSGLSTPCRRLLRRRCGKRSCATRESPPPRSTARRPRGASFCAARARPARAARNRRSRGSGALVEAQPRLL